MTTQEHEKLRKIAQEISDFFFENDFYNYMEYCESLHGEYIDWDGIIEQIVTDLEEYPANFIYGLSEWEDETADKIAQEITDYYKNRRE